MSAEAGQTQSAVFPRRLFVTAIIASLFATVVGVWLPWHLQARLADLKTRQFQLAEYFSRVMLFDEALTMSARMAAATGNAAYEERYNKFDADLDKLLKETENAVRRPEVRQFIDQTDEANRKLVEMERHAFGLTFKERRAAEASALLASGDYMKWKKVYADSVEKTIAWDRRAAADEQRTLDFFVTIEQGSAVATSAALMLIWFIALRAARRWSEERVGAEAALRKAQGALEQQVAERTEALAHEIEEHKLGEAALRESQQIVRAILDTVPARIFWKDKNLIYLGCNEPFARDAGFSKPEDVIGKDDYQMAWRDRADLYRADDREVVDSARSKLLIKEPSTTPDGKTTTILTSKVPLRTVGGEVSGVLGTYMDVTEREQAAEALQQSEARFKAIFDNAGDGIVLADMETKSILAANKSFRQMLGYMPDEVPQLGINSIRPGESAPRVIEGFESQLHGGSPIAANFPVMRKDGSVFFADINSTPVTLSGKTYLLAIFRDVSARKVAEDKLKFANALLQAEIESAPDGVIVIQWDKPVASFNRNFIGIWSIPADIERSRDSEAVFATVLSRLSDPSGFKTDVLRLRDQPESVIRQHEMELKDGRTVEYYGRAFLAESGAPMGRIWFFRDVTERKNAALNLEQSEVRFRAIFATARDGIALADLTTHKLVSANASLLDMLGYVEDEVPSLTVERLHPADSLAEAMRTFERQARGELHAAEFPVQRKDGSIFPAEITAAPLAIGGRDYLLGIFRDISERKAAEDRLKFANMLLQAEIENAPDGVLVIGHDRKILLYNRRFVEMWGVPDEVVQSRDDARAVGAILGRLKDPDGFVRRVNELYARPEERSHDEVDLTDGRVFERYSGPVPDATGKNLGRIWFFRDITENKNAAKAVAQSEARFRAIFDNARDGIALVRIESRSFAAVNDRFCKMLDYSEDELTKLSLLDVHPPEALAHIEKEFASYAGRETHTLMDIPLRRKNGSILFADINSAPVDIGGTKYVLGIFRDATERRHAEEEVRKSEEKYRNLVESSTDLVWEIDADGRYTYYSPAARDLLGYESTEMIGKTPFEFMAPAEAERVGAIFAPIAAGKQPFSMLENTMLTKRGVPVVMETSGVPVFDKAGAYVGYRGIERDITQRKQAEAELQKRDALLHAVAFSAAEFLTAPALDEAIQKSLELVSTTIHADRMVVLEHPAGHIGQPIPRYIWESANIAVKLDKRYFENPHLQTEEISAWEAPLQKGRIVTSDVRTATGDVKKLLVQLGIKKNVIVPVMIDGKYWGQIGVDSCNQERTLADFEIEILQTLADLIGNAIQRGRYVTEITNANRIVQNTPTILYRLRGVPTLPMIYVSQNVKLFGYEPAMLIESPNLYQRLVHPDDAVRVRNGMAESLEPDHARGTFEFRLLTSSGDYRWVENRYSQIRDSAGRLVEVEGLLIDITERKAADEKISLLARTDPLTGLANRTTFIERLQQFFVASRRGAPAFALHYIDLDRFKDINDTLGHPVGDRFLIEMAHRLTGCVRETDLAGRLGGDEFAVLQADVGDNTDSGALADKIRTALAQPVRIEGNLLHITASIGIAVCGPDTAKPEDLLAQADIALYRAKEEGRDQYRFHSEELDVAVREQVAITDELRTAIERNELGLFYQPQVELSTGKIVGMEALVRWRHPTRGLLSASQFIPVAERTGLIIPIGQWVLDHACEQMHRWRQAGCAPSTVAVNVSPGEIKTDDKFIDFVQATLAKWQLRPEELEIDVTESMLAWAALAQNDILERLQKLGIKISIDDFGTKYSSLDYLKTYRVNRLKIPPVLTSTAARNPANAAMVRAIVGIARELNIEVMAQGVETESQWSFLTATSPVTKVQGYYYSEPVSAARAGELLRGGHLVPSNNKPSSKVLLAE